MYLIYMLAYWYNFSKWYILGSIFITHILNRGFKKLWLSPLLINTFSVILLGIGIYIGLLQNQEIGFSVINIYVPVVFTSILMNVVIFLYKKLRKK